MFSVEMTSDALASSAWQWFGIGLGAAFLATMAVVVVLIARAEKKSGIDQGFLGLILLLCTIFYLLGFSFLVAASVKGMDIKLAVVAVDALVLLGSKLLTPHFLEYLRSENNENAARAKRKRNKVRRVVRRAR